jgi:hypothetical protein
MVQHVIFNHWSRCMWLTPLLPLDRHVELSIHFFYSTKEVVPQYGNRYGDNLIRSLNQIENLMHALRSTNHHGQQPEYSQYEHWDRAGGSTRWPPKNNSWISFRRQQFLQTYGAWFLNEAQLYDGKLSLEKLQLWKDDAVFEDPLCDAQGRYEYEAQWV